MKRWKYSPVVLLALAVIFSFGGCSTTSSNVIKERGVYTTMAMEGQNLDLPASGYTSCKTFGPGQTPAAVVVGYGYWDGTYNRPQAFNLEVVEVTSGTVIINRSGNALAGKAEYINLPIRKSGNYQLKLIIKDSIYDTWDFTVNREVPPSPPQPQSRLRSMPKAISAPASKGWKTDAFNQYDDYLLQAFNDAVQKEYANVNHDDFAQIPPGRVIVQFDLSEAGQFSSPKIIENTLNETLGQFFLRTLQNGSPYKPWPAAARAAIGTGSRSVKVTFYYD